MTLTWRKQQRLGVKDVLAAQGAPTWFLKIEPLNASSPNVRCSASSWSNFSRCNGWIHIPVSAQNAITHRPQSVIEWRAKVGVCSRGGDTWRSKVYQGKSESPFRRAPMDSQWMKMEITAGQWRWPQSLRLSHSFFHLHIFARLLSVFSPNQ